MPTTQLAVNPEKLIQHLRFSFTQSTTVLGELMQNARRAGADFIRFDYDPQTQTLTVTDNGCGIACLDTLLTVAESGWDAALIEREMPYGLGFLSALFACEVIGIDSQCGRITAATADLLAFKSIRIEPPLCQGLTCLTLSQFKPEAVRIEPELRRLARGFPIEVRFNGVSLDRDWAVTSGLTFIETELGLLYLEGLAPGEDWLRPTEAFHLYLQGLPVYHSRDTRHSGHVVHLDSRRFQARLPDRDRLIDEAQVIAEVKALIAREARRRLAAIKASLSAQAFVEGYNTLETYRCLDLLNDVPLLPKQCVAVIQDYPVKEGSYHVNLANPSQAVSRSQVENGQCQIVALDDLEDVGALRWMFAWYQDAWLVQPGLDAGHWLFDYLIDWNTPAISLELINVKHQAFFAGQWVSGQTVFCEKYRLTLNGESVEIDNDALYDEDEDRFIVPGGEASGRVVGQAASFQDEWGYVLESARETDEWDFQHFVVANTSEQAADALHKLLPRFGSCPAVFSRTFQIVLDASGEVVNVVEVA